MVGIKALKNEKIVSGSKLSKDEKYFLYEASVQNPEADILFINKVYKSKYQKLPKVLREDFCGTGKLLCEWVSQGDDYRSYGIDLDPEPMNYGKKFHWAMLNDGEKNRAQYIHGNVLDPAAYPKQADVVVAFNFSYYFFKERNELLKYFKAVFESLKNSESAFFIDLFGGTEARKVATENVKHKKHTYYWDCEKYNPLTAECFYSIHFKVHDKNTIYKRVFSYDWRMWDTRELIDLLQDAGFKNVYTFWEGVDGQGFGNGVFKETKLAENCESWVTYLCATPN